MTYEKICQIKSPRLCLCKRLKNGTGCIELVAVGPRLALGVKLLRNAINSTAGTAVGVGNQYIGVLGVMLGQYRL